jgi:hypothetical protein
MVLSWEEHKAGLQVSSVGPRTTICLSGALFFKKLEVYLPASEV